MRAWILSVSLLPPIVAAQETVALPPVSLLALQQAGSPFATPGPRLAFAEGRLTEDSAQQLFEAIAWPDATGYAARCAIVLSECLWDRKAAEKWLRSHREERADAMNPMLGIPGALRPDERLARLESRADLDAALAGEADETRARIAPYAGALGHGSPTTLGALVACLSSQTAALRWRAAWAIQLSAGTAAAREAVPALRERLTDPDPRVRGFAAAALATIAPADPAPVAVGAALCGSQDETDARLGVHVLGLTKVMKGKAAAPLAAALRRHQLPEAALALGACGEVARPALPLLISQALGSGVLAEAAGRALRQLELADEAWVEALLAHCEGPVPMLCCAAVRRLGELGPRARSAIPKLTGLLASDDHYVRLAAVSALAAIGPDAAGAVPRIERIFRESDAWSRVQRRTIAKCAAGFGPAAVPVLELAAQDPDAEVREPAAAALAKLKR